MKNNQDITNHLLEDQNMKLKMLLERMQDGDLTRKHMQKNLKEIIKINEQISSIQEK